MKAKTLAIGAAAILLAASCSNNQTEQTKEDSLSFTHFTQSQAYKLDNSASVYQTDSDLMVLCSADLLIPADLLGKDTDTFRTAVENATVKAGTPDSVSSLFMRQASDFGFSATEVAMPAGMSAADYDGYYGVTGSVSTLTPELVSYRIEHDTYMPRAAHGEYTVTYINYDINSGRVLTLDNIFTSEGLEALPELISHRANLMSGFIGDTEISALPSDGNFTITDDNHIIFVYQPMEVASYAQGVINVPFDLFRLAQYMTPEAKALFKL